MPPCHPYPIFFNCHYSGKGALCFCFDLAMVFLHGATMPHLQPIFLVLSLMWEGELCFCFDLEKVFLQRGTMTHLQHNFFRNCHYCRKGHYASASNWPRYFLRVPPCQPYTQTFSGNVIIVGRGHYASASTQPRYFYRVPPCHPSNNKNFDFPLLREGALMSAEGGWIKCFILRQPVGSPKNEQQLVVPGNKTMKQICECCDMSQMQPLFRPILTACPTNLFLCVRFMVGKNRRVRYTRSRK